MKINRILLVCVISFSCGLVAVGCKSSDATVDAPLLQNAPPPPKRPNKPEVSPMGAGGGTTTGGGQPAPTGAQAPP